MGGGTPTKAETKETLALSRVRTVVNHAERPSKDSRTIGKLGEKEESGTLPVGELHPIGEVASLMWRKLLH